MGIEIYFKTDSKSIKFIIIELKVISMHTTCVFTNTQKNIFEVKNTLILTDEIFVSMPNLKDFYEHR